MSRIIVIFDIFWTMCSLFWGPRMKLGFIISHLWDKAGYFKDGLPFQEKKIELDVKESFQDPS